MNLGYRGPFDEKLLNDLKHPLRRDFLINSAKTIQDERNRILQAIDAFCMIFQSANLPKGKHPQSMFGEKKQKEKSYFMQTIPTADGPKQIKVYF